MFVIFPLAGPEIFLQRYAVIVPSGSVPPPLSETLFVGKVIV